MTVDATLARRALRLLDLTNLDDSCTENAIDALCARALDPRGPVAAVCIWPQFIKLARRHLVGSPVRVATVANFPSGDEDLDRVLDGVREALRDGADEIDLVIPYRALIAGEQEPVHRAVEAVRDEIAGGALLKVILETGELATPDRIAIASRIAIAAGADFIKTSTGKTKVSATPEAVDIMLAAIREADRPVGLKPSGGIRTLEDARRYIDQAEAVMGQGWATPATFRFGASGLYDALIAAIDGRASDAPAAATPTPPVAGGSY
jgi:deoxyribose-phosphate aldolase